jgi:Uma2 family endonuclease
MALQPKSEPTALVPELLGISMTEEEYLRTEPDSEVRREYIDGRAYAMGGASFNHNIISTNILTKCTNHLKGTPCRTFMADMSLHFGKTYVYPDVLVDCSKIEGKSRFAQAPILIVEVLSKSTRRHDLTKKLIQYINIPTLKEYVLIEQDIVSVQVLRKSNDWKIEYHFLGDLVRFESIDLSLMVEEIYDHVDNNEINEFRQEKLSLEHPDHLDSDDPS